jgi:glycosyltransferase involved in cell wall biosynthesis
MEVQAIGPGFTRDDLLTEDVISKVNWKISPILISPLAARYTSLRYLHGRLTFKHDVRCGEWALGQARKLKPGICYCFTQVALETLQWARETGIPTILDNPNGHLRDYREMCVRESLLWFGKPYLGHPTEAMVERVEKEYDLAKRIRVSSQWAKRSMVSKGVPESKIIVSPQPTDLARYLPPTKARDTTGPLRICYVGNLTLGKGFQYLLRALRLLGSSRVQLKIVGATGDHRCRRLLAVERDGLDVKAAPGDPLPAYQWAEILAFPTLHDGFGFVVAEAMACELPVIVTDRCGAAEYIRDRPSGWIVPPADAPSLVSAIDDAWRRRSRLRAMGLEARATVADHTAESCAATLKSWVLAT